MSPRVYTRRFDHDEARRRYVAGESVVEMAREFGVHQSAVYQVVSERIRLTQKRVHARIAAAGRCDVCGGPMNGLSRYTGSVRCRSCFYDDLATSARPGELHCFSCNEWKPDEAFPCSRAARIRRRGRHGACRVCQALLKREYRARNPEKTRAYDRAYNARRANALDNGAERSPSAERTEPELTQASADRSSREAVQANKGKVT